MLHDWKVDTPAHDVYWRAGAEVITVLEGTRRASWLASNAPGEVLALSLPCVEDVVA